MSESYKNDKEAQNRFYPKFKLVIQMAIIGIAVGFFLDTFMFSKWNYSFIYNIHKFIFDINADIHRNLPKDHYNAKFALVDIDKSTYEKFNNKRFFPRDLIAEILRKSLEQGAEAVVVDLDLSEKANGDEALKAYLESLNGQDGPPVFLVRPFNLPENEDASSISEHQDACFVPIETPFDGVVAASRRVFLGQRTPVERHRRGRIPIDQVVDARVCLRWRRGTPWRLSDAVRHSGSRLHVSKAKF